MTVYLLLFFEFFKTGLFAVGGGLATLPFLYEMADKYTWFDKNIIPDMIAISESTPGPIGINMATYAGYNAGHTVGGVFGGIIGGIIATLSLVLPSLIIIVIVAKFLEKFKESQTVQSVFYGLRPAVTALIAYAGYQVMLESIFTLEKFKETNNFLNIIDFKATIMFIILFFLIKKTKVHPAVYIGLSAVVGMLIF